MYSNIVYASDNIKDLIGYDVSDFVNGAKLKNKTENDTTYPTIISDISLPVGLTPLLKK